MTQNLCFFLTDQNEKYNHTVKPPAQGVQRRQPKKYLQSQGATVKHQPKAEDINYIRTPCKEWGVATSHGNTGKSRLF